MAKKPINLLCNRRMMSSPDNPFSADGRKPKRPLVTDRKMRDALLRREFDVQSVSQSNYAYSSKIGDQMSRNMKKILKVWINFTVSRQNGD